MEPPPPPFFFFFYYPHISSTQISSSLRPISPFLLSLAFTCVTLLVLPWWSLMLPPHTSPPVLGWGWIVVDDADRLWTSSLPLGVRPIFTSGHVHVCGAPSPLSGPGWLPECNCIWTSNSHCCQQQQSCYICFICICDFVSVCNGLITFAPARSVLGFDDGNIHVSMLVAGPSDFLCSLGSLALFPLRCWSTTCGPGVNMHHDITHNYDNFLFNVGPGKIPVSVTERWL